MADPFDSEIRFGSILTVGGALLALTAVSALLMWLLFKGLESRAARVDPTPTPMVVAGQALKPAGPKLEPNPAATLREARQAVRSELESYGWVDEGSRVAHIPIDLAIDWYVEGAVEGAGEGAVEGASGGAVEGAVEGASGGGTR